MSSWLSLLPRIAVLKELVAVLSEDIADQMVGLEKQVSSGMIGS